MIVLPFLWCLGYKESEAYLSLAIKRTDATGKTMFKVHGLSTSTVQSIFYGHKHIATLMHDKLASNLPHTHTHPAWSKQHAPINTSLIGAEQTPHTPKQNPQNPDNLWNRQIKERTSLNKEVIGLTP